MCLPIKTVENDANDRSKETQESRDGFEIRAATTMNKEPVVWSYAMHAVFGVVVSYFMITHIGHGDWPMVLVFFPMMELAGINGIASLAIVGIALWAFIFLMVGSLTRSNSRRYWIGAHLSFAVFYLWPTLVEVYGTYIGP